MKSKAESWGKRESPGHPYVMSLRKEERRTIKRKEEMKRTSTINYLGVSQLGFSKIESASL